MVYGLGFLWLIALSFIPSFEGRYVVLVAPVFGFSVFEGFLAACIGVILLGLGLGFGIGFVDAVARRFAESSFWLFRRIGLLYLDYVGRVRVRARKYVERYGFIGLVLFVAVPLPLTGVWTGALAGLVFGVPRRILVPALVVGGLLSNTITLTLALTGVYVVSG